MKLLRQFMIILAISFLGEICAHLIPAPIPASIYGMILLFLGLQFKLLKLEQVKDAGSFLVQIMPVLFVSPAVGLLDCWSVFQENLLAICVIVVGSLLLTFAASGILTQWFLRKKEEHHD